MEVTSLLLGWTLGLLSPVITDRIRIRFRKRDFRRSVAAELRQIQERFVVCAYHLEAKCGEFNSRFIAWFVPLIRKYHGVLVPEEILKTYLALEGKDDSELQSHAALYRSQSTGLVRLTKLHLPYMQSRVDNLHYFDSEFAQMALAILDDLGHFNQIVDMERMFFKMTYELQDDENRKRAYDEQRRECLYAAEIARLLADKIDGFLTVHCNNQ